MRDKIINNVSGNVFNGNVNIVSVTNNNEEHEEKTVGEYTAKQMRESRFYDSEKEDDDEDDE
ncbi:hypothetical protein GCWU000282_02454 [Catonella morbi ATCC 51271]|jgi:hypothetical protein|uniref:Uncharacterized protein n=1 Tax=Catonella morbi ATCC 51271 TaxID=592026 RepID=V2Z5X2_9FIRM|nr:hypothetical protein [Catonella morbi]ESL02320.1 hypothetical protein GCWU000282_02454 [Catonella morbi ATCC 51271]